MASRTKISTPAAKNRFKTGRSARSYTLAGAGGSWTVAAHAGGPARHYATVLNNLVGGSVLPARLTMQHVRSAINEGLPKSAFERLKQVTGLSTEELSPVVRIPSRTLARRKHFSPDESERILRVSAVFHKALELFENLEQTRQWFTTPDAALADKTPLQFCDTQPGAEEVSDLLGRIEHGVFS